MERRFAGRNSPFFGKDNIVPHYDPNAIKENLPVLGADGAHVGTVDHLDGDRIKLMKADSSNNQHHYLSVGLTASVDEQAVHLSANGAEASQFFEESG